MSQRAKIDVIRWPEASSPSEATIRRRLADEGLRPYQWSNRPGDVYAAHRHRYHKVIYVLRGSITFGLPERDEKVTLGAGDRLELPPDVLHDAVVGADGVVCLEAHR
jgi:quercetin dioxygenase-like cupin family protein